MSATIIYLINASLLFLRIFNWWENTLNHFFFRRRRGFRDPSLFANMPANQIKWKTRVKIFFYYFRSAKTVYCLLSNSVDSCHKSGSCARTWRYCLHLLLFHLARSLARPPALPLSLSSLCVLAGCQVLRIWGMLGCNVLIKFALFPKWPGRERETERVAAISLHTWSPYYSTAHTHAHSV